ncbi:MAG: hypothetical protein WC107_03745 [Patescibacteria group bacterium]
MPRIESAIIITDDMRNLLMHCCRLSGLTQKELARRAGVEQSWASRALNGSRKRVERALIQSTVKVVASALEEKQEIDCEQAAAHLRSAFGVGGELVTNTAMLFRTIAITGLVNCGLGMTDEQAVVFCNLPCLFTRLEAVKTILRGLVAIANASNGKAAEAVGQMIIVGIVNCGLGITEDQAKKFVSQPNLGERIDSVLSAMSAIAAAFETGN